jgi:[protein-PII] uridylyltransferase
MAASQFRIVLPEAAIKWPSIKKDLGRALAHEFALEARLADRARTYHRRRRTQAELPDPPSVVFDDEASSNSTVIVVRAATKVGILHRITKSLSELGLDIRHATVQTTGMEVVDTFYVRASGGGLIANESHRKEIQRAVIHAVS